MIMGGRIVLEGDDVCGWLLGIGRRHGYYDVWRCRASCKRFWISWCERGERLRGRGREEREGFSGLQLVSKETIQLLPSLKDFDLQISS